MKCAAGRLRAKGPVLLGLLLFVAVVLPKPSLSAGSDEYSPFIFDETRPGVLRLEGVINARTPLMLARALSALSGITTLELSSPGGTVYDALVMASNIRTAGLRTSIPAGAKCHSACAYLFFAGTERSAEGELGVHQVAAENSVSGQFAVGDIAKALEEFDVPSAVLFKMLQTPPDRMYVFSPQEIAELGLVGGGTPAAVPAVVPEAPEPVPEPILDLAASIYSDTLVYCSEGAPEGFDPAAHTSGTTYDASSRTIYNRLTGFAPGSTRIVPRLAESWDISADGMEYTFHLRPGVQFHTTDYFTPTRDLNADDVIFSFARQLDTSHPWHSYFPGAAWLYSDALSMPDIIKQIVKIDDLTVKFVLRRPEAPLIANLAMDFTSILSREYADQLAASGRMENLNTRPIGTGPFQFISYRQDEIRYRANPEYWNGKQNIESLIFDITPSANKRRQKLESGACQVMSYPNPTDIEALRARAGVVVAELPSLNIGYLAYNTRMPPFDNPQVRKALNMAIDKQAIVKAVYKNTGRSAVNPIPPTMWSYNEEIVDDPYDPQVARQMLRQAGVDALSMKIWSMPVLRPYNPDARRMAEMIKADLEQIGVTVDIVSYEWGEFLSRSREPDRAGAVLLGWTGDNGDPDNFLAILLGCDGVGGSNRAQWCNAEFENLVQRAKAVSDPLARAELYKSAQEVFKRETPWLTIAHSLEFVPMSAKVKGYVMSAIGAHGFEGVSLEQ